MKVFTAILTICLVFIGLFCEAMPLENLNRVENLDKLEAPIFLLPVDHIHKPVSNLRVTLPKAFSSIQSLENFALPDQIMIEYIPNGESPDNWSEIITIHKFIGRKLQAYPFLKLLKKELASKTIENKVISFDPLKEGAHIERAELIMEYMANNQREVIGALYYSGPFDAAGVQYTIRLNEKMTEEKAVNKISTYFKDNVSFFERVVK